MEGRQFSTLKEFVGNRIKEAKSDYKHELYEDRAAWFFDTPGVLGTREVIRQELQITFPLGIIMPRVYWMKPGQSLFVGGLIRIDLIQVKSNILPRCLYLS